MRKSEREIKEFEQIADVLHRCGTIRLGLHGEEFPYIVPLSFGMEIADGQLIVYVHGAREGLKHDLLARDNRVCVEADLCHRFVEIEQGITAEYESIIGFGHAQKVTGEEALHGLDLLLAHCGFSGYPYDRAVLDVLTVYRITLSSVTGKRRSV